MNTKEIIDQFIEKEKRIQPSDKLNERIFAKSFTPVKAKNFQLVRIIAAAACIVLVIFSGIKIGKTYGKPANYAGVNINDSEIENLNYYITQNNE